MGHLSTEATCGYFSSVISQRILRSDKFSVPEFSHFSKDFWLIVLGGEAQNTWHILKSFLTGRRLRIQVRQCGPPFFWVIETRYKDPSSLFKESSTAQRTSDFFSTLISGHMKLRHFHDLLLSQLISPSLFFFFFFFFCLFRATLVAYGSSQARGQIRAAAVGLHHSHSSSGSELRLWPTPQPMAPPDS